MMSMYSSVVRELLLLKSDVCAFCARLLASRIMHEQNLICLGLVGLAYQSSFIVCCSVLRKCAACPPSICTW